MSRKFFRCERELVGIGKSHLSNGRSKISIGICDISSASLRSVAGVIGTRLASPDLRVACKELEKLVAFTQSDMLALLSLAR